MSSLCFSIGLGLFFLQVDKKVSVESIYRDNLRFGTSERHTFRQARTPRRQLFATTCAGSTILETDNDRISFGFSWYGSGFEVAVFVVFLELTQLLGK